MISAIVNGIEYSLDDGNPYFLIGDNGWGMVPILRLEESGPLQHGETDIGFRVQKRTASLALKVIGSSRNDMYAKRAIANSLFAPTLTPIKLRWDFDDISKEIEAYVTGIDSGSEGRTGFSQNLLINFNCPKGVFYNPVDSIVTFSLGGGTDSFEIPHAVPHYVGSSSLDLTQTLTNNGDWLSYPYKVRIVGPITNPIITNQSTGKVLSFDGQTINSGEYIELDLRYGYKTVKDQDGLNVIDKLTDSSDLSTFAIESSRALDDGSNLINIVGSSITVSSQVVFSWNDNYLGI